MPHDLACQRCALDGFGVISLDGEWYLNRAALLPVLAQMSQTAGAPQATVAPMFGGPSTFTYVGRQGVAAYDRVEPTTPLGLALRDPLASVSGDKIIDAFIVRLKSGLAAGPLHVRLGAKPPCDSTAIVACATPDGDVELNTDHFAFTISTAAGPLVAAGKGTPVSLRDILLHEVGHWFGLIHAGDDSPLSGDTLPVMAKEYGDGARCLTLSEVAMLDEAADLSWALRLKSCAGLIYSKKQR